MPVDITLFPPVCRTRQRITPEIAAEYGLDEDEQGEQVDYEFADRTNTIRPGLIDHQVIERLRPDAETSLIVHRYKTEAEMGAHFDAYYASGQIEELLNLETHHPGGYFTLARTPTRKSWPGPLLIYVDTVDVVRKRLTHPAAKEWFGEEVSEDQRIAVTSAGEILPEAAFSFEPDEEEDEDE